MSTTTLNYTNLVRVRRPLTVGLIVILIVISLVLIISAILVITSSQTRYSYQADLIPIVNIPTDSLLVAVPVPTPSITNTQPIAFETPMPVSRVASEPSVVPVPVPTPPS
jgi:hypothetical protein